MDGCVASETFLIVIRDIHVMYVLIKTLPVNKNEKAKIQDRIRSGYEVSVDQLIKKEMRNDIHVRPIGKAEHGPVRFAKPNHHL